MIRFREVSFSYQKPPEWVIRQANFEIPPGRFCLVCGASGSGKSTLLRLINGLVPHFSGGYVEGEIAVQGVNPIQAGPAQMSRRVGFVFQDPETQFILDNVEDEIAFNLENAAVPPAEISQRIQEVLQAIGIEHLRHRRLASFSGGEKQKVAIATVLSLTPSILILDEPTSQLDGQSAEEILTLIQHLARQRELTILLAEHRLDRLLHFADMLVYLPGDGRPIQSGDPRRVLLEMEIAPPVVQLAKRLGYHPLPLSIAEGRQMIHALGLDRLDHHHSQNREQESSSESSYPLLSVEEVSVAYGTKPVLSKVNFQLFPSQLTCLMGHNGAGKTTLLRAILGLVSLRQGTIRLQGKDLAAVPTHERSRYIGYLPQDPNALLFAETVQEELMLTLRNHGLAEDPERVNELLQKLGLSASGGRYPRDLSVGERQRVALGAILITQPPLLLLDEPTRGLDEKAKAELGDLLRTLKEKGKTILVVTHDVEFMLKIADQLLVLKEGELIGDGFPPEVLRTTAIRPAQLLQLFPQQNFSGLEQVLAAIDEVWYRRHDKNGPQPALVFRSDGNKPRPPE